VFFASAYREVVIVRFDTPDSYRDFARGRQKHSNWHELWKSTII